MAYVLSLFCQVCNKPTNYTITVDGNGDYIATCTNQIVTGQDENGNDIIGPCMHTVKFSRESNLGAQIAAHNEANQPAVQVNPDGSVELTEDELAAIQAAIEANPPISE